MPASWRRPINVETAVVRYGHAPYEEQNLLQERRPRLGAQMSAWIATALAVAIGAMSAITSVSAEVLRPGHTPNCFNIPTTIDFSSVPEICKQIVSEEKPGQKQKQPTGEPPAAAPYTGPRFLGQVRDQDERRSLAIPGHWSDGPRSDCVSECGHHRSP